MELEEQKYRTKRGEINPTVFKNVNVGKII